jgi:hypothetical protein
MVSGHKGYVQRQEMWATGYVRKVLQVVGLNVNMSLIHTKIELPFYSGVFFEPL